MLGIVVLEQTRPTTDRGAGMSQELQLPGPLTFPRMRVGIEEASVNRLKLTGSFSVAFRLFFPPLICSTAASFHHVAVSGEFNPSTLTRTRSSPAFQPKMKRFLLSTCI